MQVCAYCVTCSKMSGLRGMDGKPRLHGYVLPITTTMRLRSILAHLVSLAARKAKGQDTMAYLYGLSNRIHGVWSK